MMLGDSAFDDLVSLIGNWVRTKWTMLDKGQSQALVLAGFREVVLDDTAVTVWTVWKLLQQPRVVFLSISDCDLAMPAILADALAHRAPWAGEGDLLPRLVYE
ncbi:hypothetical protein M427DRAFT_373901 [Gonapodya prolifera JEL478]|uniref:Uncharacterized protein n=1 Tax=Gonapodya prolifera (strain JEL478) TaxID=1344416 RepID=A0A139AUF3_GONPJ|nr:hypothetical protein M427DRAFT_373901 [Gonapodya prolifera JEL478]|eukprot:KXS20370.1 hypothetical protein M427DRAFT_373901 [Gonapodya prolifera JEL478]